jgi:hypothetical protein
MRETIIRYSSTMMNGKSVEEIKESWHKITGKRIEYSYDEKGNAHFFTVKEPRFSIRRLFNG